MPTQVVHPASSENDRASRCMLAHHASTGCAPVKRWVQRSFSPYIFQGGGTRMPTLERSLYPHGVSLSASSVTTETAPILSSAYRQLVISLGIVFYHIIIHLCWCRQRIVIDIPLCCLFDGYTLQKAFENDSILWCSLSPLLYLGCTWLRHWNDLKSERTSR